MSKIKTDNAFTTTLQAFDKNSALNRLLNSLDRHQAVFRAAEGPLTKLLLSREIGSLLHFQQELKLIQPPYQKFDVKLRLPVNPEVIQLIGEFQKSPLVEALQRCGQQTSSLQKAIEQFLKPWLDVQNRLQSVNTFAKLQGIGQALTKFQTFSPVLNSALRIDLGDWREPISWPNSVLADFQKRSALYQDLGFDLNLTEFPSRAFHETLDIAGVNLEPPSLVTIYGPPVPPSDDKEEEAQLERTNRAHDWLLRLETQLRRFIDDLMKENFGPNWPRHRLPRDMYHKWQQKKATAERDRARKWPLIAYADFTDYVCIICREDNWREVFATFFSRKEDVMESFQRLFPVRLDTMHARPITQHDELLLYVESQRLLNVVSLAIE